MSLINDALKRANQAQKQNAPDRPKLTPLQPVDTLKPGIDWASYLLPGLLAIVLVAAGAFLWSWVSSRRSASTPAETAKAQPVAPAASTVERAAAAVEPPAPKAVTAPPPAPVAAVSKPAVKISTNIVIRPAVQVVKPVDVASASAPEIAAPVAAPSVPVAPASLPQSAKQSAPVQAAVPQPDPASLPAPAPPPARVETAVPAPAPVVSKPVVAEAPKPEFPRLKVQGIVYRRTNPSAIINGKPCYVGDTIEGGRVTKIERLSVFVEFGGQTKELSMEP